MYGLCYLLVSAGKATSVGALPGITRSVLEKIKVVFCTRMTLNEILITFVLSFSLFIIFIDLRLFTRPYNLYCVGADVKPCSINQSICSLGIYNH